MLVSFSSFFYFVILFLMPCDVYVRTPKGRGIWGCNVPPAFSSGSVFEKLNKNLNDRGEKKKTLLIPSWETHKLNGARNSIECNEKDTKPWTLIINLNEIQKTEGGNGAPRSLLPYDSVLHVTVSLSSRGQFTLESDKGLDLHYGVNVNQKNLGNKSKLNIKVCRVNFDLGRI